MHELKNQYIVEKTMITHNQACFVKEMKCLVLDVFQKNKKKVMKKKKMKNLIFVFECYLQDHYYF